MVEIAYVPKTFYAPNNALVALTVSPDGDVRILIEDQQERTAEVYIGPTQAKVLAAELHCAGVYGRLIEEHKKERSGD